MIRRKNKKTDAPTSRRRPSRESGTGTVEWMLLICVALVVMVAIYYVADWAMNSTKQSIKKIEGKDK